MYTKQEIILKYYREGQSQRQIAHNLSISRSTVRRYISAYESRLKCSTGSSGSLSAELLTPPVYKASNRVPRKLTPAVCEAIDKLLEKESEKKRQGLGKQLLKKCDIHEHLVAQGFDIGYTTVCNYIQTKQGLSNKPAEAFIRQQYAPGQSCEFDWGEIKLYLNGVLKRVQLAVFTSSYSNYRFASLHMHQDTLAFMESHVAFFHSIGGAYREIVYDNMRVAVAKFVGKHEREPTQALVQLRGHYQYSHRFCNLYRGNEKGHVERSVEYIRRKAFGVKNRFDSLASAADWLEQALKSLNAKCQQLSGKSAKEQLGEEQAALLPAPTKLACAEQVQLRVDKYATVSCRTNRYSVPDHLVGQHVDVKVRSNQIQIYREGKLLATHARSFEKHAWVIDIHHYLETFKRKPGALHGSVALASSGYLQQLYYQYFEQEPRDFIDLLAYCRQHQIDQGRLKSVVARLQQSGIRHLTRACIEALLGNSPQQDPVPVLDTIAQHAKVQLAQQAALLTSTFG